MYTVFMMYSINKQYHDSSTSPLPYDTEAYFQRNSSDTVDSTQYAIGQYANPLFMPKSPGPESFTISSVRTIGLYAKHSAYNAQIATARSWHIKWSSLYIDKDTKRESDL